LAILDTGEMMMSVYSLRPRRVYLYDTTLRDGGQTMGVDYTLEQKHQVAAMIDQLGLSHLEAGWPGANPTDTAFFAAPPALATAKLTAFGMTRRRGTRAADDAGFQKLLTSAATSLCLVGKCWREQAVEALGVSAAENLDMIQESMRAAKDAGKEVLFDAEHFFDGYKSDPDYAVAALHAALMGGADWLVLCDTNGRSSPDEVYAILREVRASLPPTARLGFHGHNDRDCATANSLMAVEAGADMVQGTLNGLGERCGNANLVTLIPLLMDKGYDVGVSDAALRGLTDLAHAFGQLVSRDVPKTAPFVGRHAFTHKAGLHASAVRKHRAFYEHFMAERAGNHPSVAVSSQAGLANVKALLEDLGLPYAGKEDRLPALLKRVKERAAQGDVFDDAPASFGVLAMEVLHDLTSPFTLKAYEATAKGGLNGDGEKRREAYASVQVKLNGRLRFAEGLGDGPVHALDLAMREVLVEAFPALERTQLVNFKVSLLNQNAGTAAQTYVEVTSADDQGHRWTTMGVSEDVVHATLRALTDAYTFKLCRDDLQRAFDGPACSLPVAPARHARAGGKSPSDSDAIRYGLALG
jgi:2-isopropylmalate synthase